MKLLLRKRHLLLLAGALWGLFTGSLYAQQTVSGTVTASEDGSLLVGVTVAVQGTNNGVLTDDNGRYKITAEESSAVLVFSYYGKPNQYKGYYKY